VAVILVGSVITATVSGAAYLMTSHRDVTVMWEYVDNMARKMAAALAWPAPTTRTSPNLEL